MTSQSQVGFQVLNDRLLLSGVSRCNLAQVPQLNHTVFRCTDKRGRIWHELQASDDIHVRLEGAHGSELQVSPLADTLKILRSILKS